MSCLRLIVIVAVAMVSIADQGFARQYTRVVNGREVVVHTRALPVVVHRVLPPQHGRHITQGEYYSGRLPSAGRSSSR
jgi:hypothetical protein